MRDVVTTVFFRDVVDDFTATTLTKIDVDVWKRDSFWIQKTLEDEIKLYWVDVGYLKTVGHEATGR